MTSDNVTCYEANFGGVTVWILGLQIGLKGELVRQLTGQGQRDGGLLRAGCPRL